MTDILQWLHESWIFIYYLGLLVLQVSVAASALVFLGLIIHYTLWPEWQRDPDPRLARRLAAQAGTDCVTNPHPACNPDTQDLALSANDLEVEVATEPWHNRDRVVRACSRLQRGASVREIDGRDVEDYPNIFEISVQDHLRLLQEDPECYGLSE